MSWNNGDDCFLFLCTRGKSVTHTWSNSNIKRKENTVYLKKALKSQHNWKSDKSHCIKLQKSSFFNYTKKLRKKADGRVVESDRQLMMGGEEWELKMQRPIEGYQDKLIAQWWAQRCERKRRTLPMVPLLLASAPLAITAVCHGAKNAWMHSDTNRLYKHAATGMLDVGNNFLCYISS